MGIFDFLFKKKEEKEKATVAKEIPIDSLDQLKKILRESKEKMLEGIYPKGEKICKGVLEEIKDIKKSVNKLEEKKIDKEIGGYQIAVQMQRNFSETIPRFLRMIKIPQKIDYDSLSEFHEQLMSTLQKITKATSGNRYLYHFFENEMREFGDEMKKLIKSADELKELLESKKSRIAEFEGIEKSASDIKEIKADITTNVKEVEESKNEVERIESKIEEVRKQKERRELKESKDKLEKTRAEIDIIKRRLVDLLYPLGRPLRKLQKITLDKKESNIIQSYIDDPIKAIVSEVEESGDYPNLKQVLSTMKESLSAGKLEADEKVREKIMKEIDSVIGGSPINFIKNLKELETKRKEFEKQSSEFASIELEEKKLAERLDDLKKKIKDLEEEKKYLEEEVTNVTNEIQKKSEDLFGLRLKLELD